MCAFVCGIAFSSPPQNYFFITVTAWSLHCSVTVTLLWWHMLCLGPPELATHVYYSTSSLTINLVYVGSTNTSSLPCTTFFGMLVDYLGGTSPWATLQSKHHRDQKSGWIRSTHPHPLRPKGEKASSMDLKKKETWSVNCASGTSEPWPSSQSGRDLGSRSLRIGYRKIEKMTSRHDSDEIRFDKYTVIENFEQWVHLILLITIH